MEGSEDDDEDEDEEATDYIQPPIELNITEGARLAEIRDNLSSSRLP